MAKMSQKELLEEGFSDKIRGIASAIKTGVKQAAQQGTRLDTGKLAGGMKEAYKGQQPIAVLKDYLAKNKKMDIVKIDKSGIKKQQASAKKGYIGRIVGPKSITLIPFEGVLLGKAKRPDARQYEGPSAGVMEAFAPEDAEATGQERTDIGQIKAVHEGGRVGKQIKDLLIKHGVGEGEAAAFSTYAEHIRSGILKMIKETHPNIKFTYNPKPEMGGVDVEKTEYAEIGPDDTRVQKESLSLRDIIQLSREVLILERELSQTPKNIRRRQLATQKREAAKKAKEADPRDISGPEVKLKTPETKKVTKNKEAPPESSYPESRAHGKFLATLDDKVVLDLLKLKQKIQPGLQIKFEGEIEGETPEEQPGQGPNKGEQGMFVAEIFRTDKGLAVGDIYRQGNPEDVVLSGDAGSGEGKSKTKVSPFDEVVTKLTDENQLNAELLVTRLKLNKLLKNKPEIINLVPATILKPIRGRTETDILSPADIEKVKKELIRQRIIKEGTSQRNLLRQLTLLSR